MARATIYGWLGWMVISVSGCLMPGAPPANRVPPGADARRIVAERVSAVIVTRRDDLQSWADQRFPKMEAKDDMDGGSAAPVAPDGYFLTADHVLARLGDGRRAYVMVHVQGRLVTVQARVVWRSSRADLALLKVPLATPFYYRWTPPGRWLPEGTPVMHGGIATGYKQEAGRLMTALGPEGRWTGARRFKIDIALQPGDSGGPVVDAAGYLVGINSAVEFLVPMDTAFFVDSEGNRPNVRELESLIKRDRARNTAATAGVE